MHSFAYRNGSLHCENVDLESLARKHGTPLYVYSRGTILDHYRRLDASLGALDHLVCFATKACSNLAVLSALAKEGAGFDIVSGGELFRVLQAGGDPGKCTFAGVGKTRAEIEYALRQGIYCFNAESEAEVAFIDRVAGDLGVKAPVALRVNPNVDAKTHKYISTGKSENKFGIDFSVIREAYARAAALPHIELRGLQMHIGDGIQVGQPSPQTGHQQHGATDQKEDLHRRPAFRRRPTEWKPHRRSSLLQQRAQIVDSQTGSTQTGQPKRKQQGLQHHQTQAFRPVGERQTKQPTQEVTLALLAFREHRNVLPVLGHLGLGLNGGFQ